MSERLPADLANRFASELERAGALLEDLAVSLCSDSLVFERHAGPLQRFDLITQTIGEVARLLRFRGNTNDAVLATICLDAMRDRMINAA